MHTNTSIRDQEEKENTEVQKFKDTSPENRQRIQNGWATEGEQFSGKGHLWHFDNDKKSIFKAHFLSLLSEEEE